MKEKISNELLKEKEILITINKKNKTYERTLKKITKNFIVVWNDTDRPSTTNYGRDLGHIIGDGWYFSSIDKFDLKKLNVMAEVNGGTWKSKFKKKYPTEKELKEIVKNNDEQYKKDNQEALMKNKDIIKVKYYLWDWCFSYGWRNCDNGYDTLKELKKDQKYSLENSENWKILKAEVIEGKNI